MMKLHPVFLVVIFSTPFHPELLPSSAAGTEKKKKKTKTEGLHYRNG